ncbi:MAG: hypothetical protein UU95_C0005G0033 [Parcubacteria group bacterium GW2011_GWC2_42_12]|nr:MAG: hypothetical protein UU95_C0005G0033 [Parcubacteria group bacterium GW2011_GWC2_42_12]
MDIISHIFYELLKLLNNTFIGTLFAGFLLALLGLRLYRRQKYLDADFSKREKIRELAIILLTHINISVKDYQAQLNIYNGIIPEAKVLLDKINTMSPDYLVNQNKIRFNQYVNDINNSFNKLSTYLILNSEYKKDLDLIEAKIPSFNLYLSTEEVLAKLNKQEIQSITTGFFDAVNSIKMSLKSIIDKY